ncbi:MAG: type II secretion system F family protein [Prevotellaceae bacterium]|jgi:type IV pilus assembly protein PilC|nr:type II secretion system F family protein [Prevotellaceae bacterium]
MKLHTKSGKGLTDKKKYLLFSELHSLLGSGLSFSRSFELLIAGETGNKEVALLNTIYRHILTGNGFWTSLQHSGAFTPLDYGVIRIGEETGKIAQSLLFLSDYYRKKEEQRRMLTGALSYPLIIVVVAMLVLFFMITVVIPMFEQVYTRMGGSLPAITQFMLEAASYFPAFITATGFIVLALITVKLLYGTTERYRQLTASFILHLPWVGALIKMHYRAQFCKLLHLLVGSDVPLLHSLSMLADIIRFYPYSSSFTSMTEGLKRGESFSVNMEKYEAIYGHKLVTLLKVGEETNSLDRMLLHQAVDITSELEHALKQLGNILEPTLILCIGVMVAFVLIAMYMPMFQLGQTIG